MSRETEIIADEWVAARDEIRRLRTVNAALLEALEGTRAFIGVMFDGVETAQTPLGIPVKVGAIARQADAAIALARGEKP